MPTVNQQVVTLSTAAPRELAIRLFQMQSGERFAMIVDGSTGLPLLDPTLYAMAELRKRNLGFETIKLAMYGVRILTRVLEAQGIDLVERLHARGEFLTTNEIERITTLCRLPQTEIDKFFAQETAGHTKPPRVVNLEKFRAKPQKEHLPQVDGQTTDIRLHYICGYLRWMTDRELLRADQRRHSYPAAKDAVDTGLAALMAKQTGTGKRNVVKQKRKGLAQNIIDRIHEVLDPRSPDNPWKEDFVKRRNRLYIYWLLELALRKSEALGVKLEDISFPDAEVQILRRPDNPDDPRGIYSPHAKTRDRVLGIGDALLEYTEEYLEQRRKQVRARDAGYLFVSSDDGAPLSSSGARDIFNTLRAKVPDLPVTLTAHVLRHTWNTLFIEHAYETGMSDKTRLEIMRNQNGYSDRSTMPDHYGRLAIDRKAKKESLNMQKEIHNRREQAKR